MIFRSFLAGLASLALAGAAPAQVVKVDGGSVRGASSGGTLTFRGIPFAAPPLAERRWRAPAAVQAWKGVRDATQAAPACIQNDQGWNRADFRFASEDCLTLDVGTQSLTGRRPVVVWIHGGSNRAGSAGGMVLSPMVKEGIVLVAIQYRLGIFGFLPHRKLTSEGNGSSGNYALMDQVAALRWVQRNIAKFGGDPANVTIAGESAGGQDVGLMLATPLARTLFAKAILQSGTPEFGLPTRSLAEGERLGDQVDALLETGGDIERLRSASVPALLAADLKLHDDALEANDYLWLRTTIDRKVIPAPPRELLLAGPARPIIVGSNRFELDLPGGRSRRDAFVAKAFGRNEAAARSFYRLDEPDPAPHPRLCSRDQQIATDVTFRCPAGVMADLFARHGAPVWRYDFDVGPAGGMTRHALDVAYAFGDQTFGQGLSLRPYWANFAKTGDPNGPGVPHWPRYTAETQAHVAFEDKGVTALGPLRPQPCGLLERL